MQEERRPSRGTSFPHPSSIVRSLVVLLGAGLHAAPAMAASHPFGVMDMIEMERVSNPVPSPDGRWIVFEQRTYTLEENRGTADLWLIATDGGDPRRLTTSNSQDFVSAGAHCV